jgi:hypothetical protein
MKKKNVWKTNITLWGTNEVLEGQGFYISYKEHPYLSDGGSAETALIEIKGIFKDTFRILNGDFRKQYEKLISKGFKACLKFYNKNKEKDNSTWSMEESTDL